MMARWTAAVSKHSPACCRSSTSPSRTSRSPASGEAKHDHRAAKRQRIGADEIVLMAGPCSVESEAQIITIAQRLKKAGATVLRGGAFKPRTSPYAFQGMGVEGLKLLAKAREETGMAIVTEALSRKSSNVVAEHAGHRADPCPQHAELPAPTPHRKTGKPILLKRGLAATIRAAAQARSTSSPKATAR